MMAALRNSGIRSSGNRAFQTSRPYALSPTLRPLCEVEVEVEVEVGVEVEIEVGVEVGVAVEVEVEVGD